MHQSAEIVWLTTSIWIVMFEVENYLSIAFHIACFYLKISHNTTETVMLNNDIPIQACTETAVVVNNETIIRKNNKNVPLLF